MSTTISSTSSTSSTSSSDSTDSKFYIQKLRNKYYKDIHDEYNRRKLKKEEQLKLLMRRNIQLQACQMLSARQLSEIKSKYNQRKEALLNIKKDFRTFVNTTCSEDDLLNVKVVNLNLQVQMLHERAANDCDYLKKCINRCAKLEEDIKRQDELNKTLTEEYDISGSTTTITNDTDWKTCKEYDSD